MYAIYACEIDFRIKMVVLSIDSYAETPCKRGFATAG